MCSSPSWGSALALEQKLVEAGRAGRWFINPWWGCSRAVPQPLCQRDTLDLQGKGPLCLGATAEYQNILCCPAQG